MRRDRVWALDVVQFPHVADFQTRTLVEVASIVAEEPQAAEVIEVVRAHADAAFAHPRLRRDQDSHGNRWSTGIEPPASRAAASERWQAAGVRSTQKRSGTVLFARMDLSAARASELSSWRSYASTNAGASSAVAEQVRSRIQHRREEAIGLEAVDADRGDAFEAHDEHRLGCAIGATRAAESVGNKAELRPM